MLFLAASLGLAIALPCQQQAALEHPAWAKVKQSVLKIDGIGQVSGLGILIDGNGNFLIHRSAIMAQPILGRVNESEAVVLTLVAIDEQTQLALLHAENWLSKGRTGVRVALNTVAGSSLIAATAQGPVRGEFVSDQKVGQMRPSLRYAPLSEIRLESNLGKVGGALVFDNDGALVGLLGATLTTDADARTAGSGGGPDVATKSDALASSKKLEEKLFGPQGMTVAYSLGPSVLKRVVDGFLSQDHKVKHPNIGLFFKDAAQPGALVEAVMKDSPSEQSGPRIGDLIVEFNGEPVRGPVDLAVKLFKRNTGDVLTVKYLRNGEERVASIKVGIQAVSD